MYCRNCGNQVDDNALVCPKCGVQVGVINADERQGGQDPDAAKPRGNAVGLVGFILSMVGVLFWMIGYYAGYGFALSLEIAALACSTVGWNKSRKGDVPFRRLSLAGFIVSLIFVTLSIVMLVVYISYWSVFARL